MADYNKGLITLNFQDGEEIFLFEEVEIRDSFTDPVGSFKFTTRPIPADVIPLQKRLRKGNLVGVLINGNPQGAFIITTLTTTIDKDQGIALEVEAKGVLTTPYEGHVDPEISDTFSSDTPVQGIIQTVLAPYGFTEITGDSSSHVAALTGKAIDGRAEDIQVGEIKHKEASANEGETAYAFIARILSRLGFVLRVNWEGILLIQKPDYEQEPAYIVGQGRLPNIADHFFGAITITDTNDGQFSEIVVKGGEKDKKGQKRAGGPLHRIKVDGLADPPVESFPFQDAPTTLRTPGRYSYQSDGGAVFKPFYRLDKFSRDPDFCKTTCNRTHGRHSENGYVLTGTVDGLLSSTGQVWTVDTTVRVVIDKLHIDEVMWILETTKRVSRGGGQSTMLKLIPLNSLILS